jgi:hypothetical protein
MADKNQSMAASQYYVIRCIGGTDVDKKNRDRKRN